MTYQEAIDILKRTIDTAGGVRKFAAQAGFSPAHVYDVLRGNRMLSNKMLRAIGLRKEVIHIVTYHKV